jgi:hypothetical protein
VESPVVPELEPMKLMSATSVHNNPQNGSSCVSRQARIWSLSISGARRVKSAVVRMSDGRRPAASQ